MVARELSDLDLERVAGGAKGSKKKQDDTPVQQPPTYRGSDTRRLTAGTGGNGPSIRTGPQYG